MWSFIKDIDSFVSYAIREGLFDADELGRAQWVFQHVLYSIGSSDFQGRRCASSSFNLLRALVHHKPLVSHVEHSVANFRQIAGLANYTNVEDDSRRLQLRDACIYFVHALAETFVRLRRPYDLTGLLEQLFVEGRAARLYKVLSQYFDISSPNTTESDTTEDPVLLEELSYSSLFYIVAVNTYRTTKQWCSLRHYAFATMFIKTAQTKPQIFTGLEQASANPVGSESKKLSETALHYYRLVGRLNPQVLAELAGHFRYTGDSHESLRCHLLLHILHPGERIWYSKLSEDFERIGDRRAVECVAHWQAERSKRDRQLSEDDAWETVDEDDGGSEHGHDTARSQWSRIGSAISKGDFSTALGLVDGLPGMDDDQDIVEAASPHDHVEVIRGYVASRSLDKDLMRKAIRLLKTAASSCPMANLWLAQLYHRSCQFTAAKSALTEAKFCAVTVPFTEHVLAPQSQKLFDEESRTLKTALKSPPKADYICRSDSCECRNIFKDSVDFSGIVQLFCEDGCLVTSHVDCWKSRNQRWPGTKHGLGTPCYTPDCQARVIQVSTYNSKMELSKEYLWKGSLMRKDSGVGEMDESVLAGLRVTVATLRHQMSLPELVSFCVDFSGYDKEMMTAFVESCLDANQLINPEWTKPKWLNAIRQYLESVENPSATMDDLNARLSQLVVTEDLDAQQIATIQEAYGKLQNELEEVLSQEASLRNRLVTLEKFRDTDYMNAITSEIRDLERQLVEAHVARASVAMLSNALELKKEALRNLDAKVTALKKQQIAQRFDLESEEARRKTQLNSASDLLMTIQANETESRNRFRRALMELNETRYQIESDCAHSAERATATNLRKIARVQDPDVVAANQQAKQQHFMFMKEMSDMGKEIERQAKQRTTQIQEGCFDLTDVGPVKESPLLELQRRYDQFPLMYRRAEKPTMQTVIDCVE